MNKLKLIAALLSLAACAAPAWAETPPTSAPPALKALHTAFEQAVQHYENNQWVAAFAQLAELADLGHPEATRLALQMWRYGPSLYGQRFELGDERRARWLAGARPALIADSSR